MRHVAAFAVSLLCSVAARSASVDEIELARIYGDKALVSIATGTRQPIYRAPSTATVITAEDIEASGAVDLDEVLETVPGVHVSRSNPVYNPNYVFRGDRANINNPHVLMLLNGIPVTNLYHGDRGQFWGWNGLPLENIQRIEVVRGPGSALYGSDAFSGVINIITKTAADIDGTKLVARAGSFDTYSASWQHGGKIGDIAVAAYLRAGKTRGFKEIVPVDAQTAFDRLMGTSASLAPGPVSTGHDALDGHLDLEYGKWRFRADYKGRYRVGQGVGVFSALDTGYANERRLITDLTYENAEFARDWSLTAQISRMYSNDSAHLVSLPPGAFGKFPQGLIGEPALWERHARLEVSGLYKGFRDHRMRLGAGAVSQSIYKVRAARNFQFGSGPSFEIIDLGQIVDLTNTPFPGLEPKGRRIKYVYVQDEYTFARDWHLTMGVRQDRYSDVGTTTNPRVGLVWEAAYNLTAKLLYGEAFRAPGFDAFTTLNGQPPPPLKPEKIRTTELGLFWRPALPWQLGMTLFQYRISDALTNEILPFVNSGRQSGRGGELEASYDASPSLKISGNYAHQRSAKDLIGLDAGDAPHDHLFLRAQWRLTPRWTLTPQLNWVSNRKRPAGDPRPAIADYKTVDLALRADSVLRDEVAGRWSLTASLRNLFNANAREPALPSIEDDLPLPGRSFMVEASVAF